MTRHRLLDSTIVPKDELYSLYANKIDSVRYRPYEVKAYIEWLWKGFKHLADKKFPKQIQDSFHSCFFEMYMANVLIKRCKLILQSKDKGPDFEVTKKNIFIECTAPHSGQQEKPSSVPRSIFLKSEDQETYQAEDIPIDKILLRYTSVIDTKCKIYRKYIDKGIINDTSICIIAISGANVNSSIPDISPEIILRALFPVGDPYIELDIRTNEQVSNGFTHKGSIKKPSGKPVKKTWFIDEEYRYISGIIFSNENVVMESRSGSDIGNDLMFIPNPLAKNKISNEFLGIGRTCDVKLEKDNVSIRIREL